MVINQKNAGAGVVVPTYNISYWEASLLGGLLWDCLCPLREFRRVSDLGRRMDTLASDRSERDLSASQRPQKAGCQRTWTKGDSSDLRLDPRKSVSLRTKDYTYPKLYVFGDSVSYTLIPQRLVWLWFGMHLLLSPGHSCSGL